MTNRILQNRELFRGSTNDQAIRGPEDDLLETNFTKEQDKASVGDIPTLLVTGGHSYPALPESSPWAAPLPKFDPYTDRIDPNEITSMTFGMDLSGKSVLAEDCSSLPSPTSEEAAAARPSAAVSSAFSKEEE